MSGIANNATVATDGKLAGMLQHLQRGGLCRRRMFAQDAAFDPELVARRQLASADDAEDCRPAAGQIIFDVLVDHRMLMAVAIL